MSFLLSRKSTPKVVKGKVQRKNRPELTPTYFNTPQATPMIDRCKPGFGYRHILLKRDLLSFIDILPDWKELSRGLNAVIQAPGNGRSDGWHRPGVVAVCAWERDLWRYVYPNWFEEHRTVLEMIGVECEATDEADILCKWTEGTIRAFQLVHILLHELGHHHDRMTTRSQERCSRGERYAEDYALRYADEIWDRYLDRFGSP